MIVYAQSQKLDTKIIVSIFTQVQIFIKIAIIAPMIALLQVGVK